MVMNMTLTPQVRKIGKNGREHVQNMIRMPVDMSDKLRKLALQNERSLNAEIVYQLSVALGEDLSGGIADVGESPLQQIADDIRVMRNWAAQFLGKEVV